MISFVKNLPFRQCRPPFAMQDRTLLPQIVQLADFIRCQNLVNICHIDINTFDLTTAVPTFSHDLVIFMVNPHNLISLQSLDQIILKIKLYSCQYYYLAINKFRLYSELSIDHNYSGTHDSKLLQHWQQLVALDVVWANSISHDRGISGNWIHPVTNLMFRA